MIVRIVKLTFKAEAVATFQKLFVGWKPRIRSSHGCEHLELLHDVEDPRIFFTYSQWTGSEALEAYRNSEVFDSVWPTVKALFDAPAEAWTVDREHVL